MKEKISIIDVIAVLIFILGICWGFFMEKNLSEEIRIPLQNYFFAEESVQNVSFTQFLQSECLNWLKLYLLGVCFVGIPFLLLYGYLKGMGLGFVIAFVFRNNMWDSMIFSIFVGILPKVLYCIPMGFMLIVAVRTSRKLFSINHSEMISTFLRYSIFMLLGLIGAFACIFLQWYLDFLL